MKKTIVKILSLIMVAAMLMTFLAACSKPSDQPGNTEEGKVYTVGICQLVQHDALDAASQGFQDALKEKLGDKVKFDYQVASGESAQCTTIVSQFVNKKYDLIMGNATAALAAAAEATDTIPVIGTSITDYATALNIKDWNGKTGFNVTGTSDLAPLAEQAAMVKELFPDAKQVGILYCSAEPNSKYQADIVAAELKKLGMNYAVFTFVDTQDLISVVNAACAACDVLYIPTDNTAANNTEAINNVAEPAGVPIIAGEEGICKGCGVATLSISYYDIGHKAGEMAYEILVNGADPADMAVEFAATSVKKYVEDRCSTLGVTVPASYEKIG